jgi:hypothetical protein
VNSLFFRDGSDSAEADSLGESRERSGKRQLRRKLVGWFLKAEGGEFLVVNNVSTLFQMIKEDVCYFVEQGKQNLVQSLASPGNTDYRRVVIEQERTAVHPARRERLYVNKSDADFSEQSRQSHEVFGRFDQARQASRQVI